MRKMMVTVLLFLTNCISFNDDHTNDKFCTDTCASLGAQCGEVCGKSCGECKTNDFCVDKKCMSCVPRCDQGACEMDDGCGGICGCAKDWMCQEKNCVACAETCASTGWQCGSACGQSCGKCNRNETCDLGYCKINTLCPDCTLALDQVNNTIKLNYDTSEPKYVLDLYITYKGVNVTGMQASTPDVTLGVLGSCDDTLHLVVQSKTEKPIPIGEIMQMSFDKDIKLLTNIFVDCKTSSKLFGLETFLPLCDNQTLKNAGFFCGKLSDCIPQKNCYQSYCLSSLKCDYETDLSMDDYINISTGDCRGNPPMYTPGKHLDFGGENLLYSVVYGSCVTAATSYGKIGPLATTGAMVSTNFGSTDRFVTVARVTGFIQGANGGSVRGTFQYSTVGLSHFPHSDYDDIKLVISELEDDGITWHVISDLDFLVQMYTLYDPIIEINAKVYNPRIVRFEVKLKNMFDVASPNAPYWWLWVRSVRMFGVSCLPSLDSPGSCL